jgi:hypothetical protein
MLAMSVALAQGAILASPLHVEGCGTPRLAEVLGHGSNWRGLSGAIDVRDFAKHGWPDTVLVLSRNREDSNAILRVTSRDAREGSYALEIDDSGRWNLSGTTLEEAAEAVRTGAATAGVGDRMAELVSYVLSHPEGLRRAEVAAALHMDDNAVGTYLRRATDAGRIVNPKRGLYGPPTPLLQVSHCLSMT